jgi:hypothetical protein
VPGPSRKKVIREDQRTMGPQNGSLLRHPPAIVFRKRLYVLSRGQLPVPGANIQAHEVVLKPRTAGYASKRRGMAPIPGKVGGLGRETGRVRPYVKGTFRVISSQFPHLAPVTNRRRKRRDVRTG